MAAGTRGSKGTLLVLYAPWCPFCQVGLQHLRNPHVNARCKQM
jgi:hypothetical protein